MSKPPIDLAQLVRTRREQLGLSKLELGRRISADDSTVLRIESGAIKNPRGDLLRALAEVLDLPSADLFAAAGYTVPAELPSFRPYLRAKYRDLDDEAISELEDYVARLRMRGTTDGPRDREDESSTHSHS